MIKISIQKKLHMAGGDGALNIDVELPVQSFTALYGASGAGKTSLLRIIAGLLQPEQGIIEVNGKIWLNTAKKINLPPQKRNIGLVFQDYALFPNMTVEENLLYALPANANKSKVQQLIEITGLQNLAQQKPQVLSGGQKQRVALARALVRQPEILLLDEPLSAVDDATRINLQNELQLIHQQLKLTTVLVSHHIPEIYKLANRVIRMDQGSILQAGTPAQVFGLHQQQGKLILIGEVLFADDSRIEILAQGNIIPIPTSAQTHSLKVGDKVSIHAADLSLQKLS
ncbi:ATP-binding cassette domain-containing protein [Mucilaginibacter terrae]|uniref:Molybdate transport system ATP-binding protein n=1 Tax=Mucilaginibacter terrae TaxID=1955052 RepID=A0ABU3GVY4_9SPHI|nr:ATP-binding cassette domain-containing protein [Mucilaginibacter terrae]MDT3403132.1 molybdate transport system ATP-binding protein [Mucilaginibacter terrae]